MDYNILLYDMLCRYIRSCFQIVRNKRVLLKVNVYLNRELHAAGNGHDRGRAGCLLFHLQEHVEAEGAKGYICHPCERKRGQGPVFPERETEGKKYPVQKTQKERLP